MIQSSQPRQTLARELTRAPADLRRLFRGLKSGTDVADLLELDWTQLYFITTRAAASRYSYSSFTLPKKNGGLRIIQAPHPTVKVLQRKLLTVLMLVYKAHPAAHGFVSGRGIRTNATPHIDKRWVLNLDLEEFFPRITFPRVRGLFMRHFGIPSPAATVLARICCNTGDTPDHLAQGAPTSPILSNMICHGLDQRLVTLAKANGAFYTRYADDLTFSTNRTTFPSAIATSGDDRRLAQVSDDVREILRQHGFSLNEAKSRLANRDSRQQVTGLNVNERVNIPRNYIRNLRGMLHAWKAHGYDAASERYREKFDVYGQRSEFRQVVAGALAFVRDIRGVDDRLFRRLYGWARELEPQLFGELPPLSDVPASLAAAVREFSAVSGSDDRANRRAYLRRMFASARGTLWLIDPGLRIEPVQDLVEVIDCSSVPAVHLLSRDRPPGAHIAEYSSLRARLAATGVNLEWRVADQRFFHDRWLADDSYCVHFGGPFAAVYDPLPPLSQNVLSRRPEQFEFWWAQGQGLPVSTGHSG